MTGSAKQSSFSFLPRHGSLRAARNDHAPS
jgi:hypothetical protein